MLEVSYVAAICWSVCVCVAAAERRSVVTFLDTACGRHSGQWAAPGCFTVNL